MMEILSGSYDDNSKCIGKDVKAVPLPKFCKKNLLHDTKISLKSGNRLLSYGQKTIFNMAAFRYLEFLTNFTFGHVTHRVPNLLLCTKVRQNRVILCLDMAINDFQDVVYSPS